MTFFLMYLFQGLFTDTTRPVDVSLMMTNQGERKLLLKLRSNQRREAFRRRYAGHWYVCKELSCLFVTEVRSAFYYPQLYSRRKKFLKSPNESELLWASIDCRYMTEESEGEENKIHQHELPRRSQGYLLLTRS